MLSLDALTDTVTRDAAIRRVRRLQPAGGPGDKIFPPTYPGEGTNAPPRHAFERRRIAGADALCVLIDSVQSQANRLEEALLAAHREGRLDLPFVTVDFRQTDLADIGEVTSLDAPHRVFDAIIRDSEDNGVAFRETAPGQSLIKASARNATAMFGLAPSALLFGAWNSTGEGGGLGAKFARSIVSEIVGVGVAVETAVDRRTGEVFERASGQRTGSRIDPLGIRRSIEIYRAEGGNWAFDPKEAGAKAKKLKPSEINHGNIAPSVMPLGVTIDYGLHTAVLSCAGLRRLSFPDDAGAAAAQRDTAGRTVLAALGLLALVEQDRQGYALRSRCDLVPEEVRPFELVHADGSVDTFDLDPDAAAQLFAAAVDAARSTGLPWKAEGIALKPQDRLLELVRRSREQALQDAAEPESE